MIEAFLELRSGMACQPFAEVKPAASQVRAFSNIKLATPQRMLDDYTHYIVF